MRKKNNHSTFSIHYQHTNTALQNNIHVYKVQCGSLSAFGPGASGLPYYCTPHVCVPDVFGGLAVWRHNNNTNKTKIA